MLNSISYIGQAATRSSQLLDEEGFLIDAEDWNRDFSQKRAKEKGVILSDKHWQLIELIRDKYLRLGSLPPMRTVCRSVGLNKQALKLQFGSCLNLWKIAGLPNPGEEAKTYMN